MKFLSIQFLSKYAVYAVCINSTTFAIAGKFAMIFCPVLESVHDHIFTQKSAKLRKPIYKYQSVWNLLGICINWKHERIKIWVLVVDRMYYICTDCT